MPKSPMPGFRAPRVMAEINGLIVNTVIHASISMNHSGKSSRFALTVSMGRQTGGDQWLAGATRRVAVSLLVHTAGAEEPVRVFEGIADDLAFDPIRKIAHIQGRDYSAILGGSTIQSSFSNLTASEIAGMIADQHGFPSNITPTHAMVGSYRAGNYNQMLLNDYSGFTDQWSLLAALARSEDFDLFFDGQTLVFQPSDSDNVSNVQFNARDLIGLRFHRRCPVASQTKVMVKSWDSWLNQPVSHEETQSFDWLGEAGSPEVDASGNETVFIKPNMSFSGAERLCKNYIESISQDSLYVDATMEGETSLRPGDVMTITGTGTFFDQRYVVRSIDRRFSSGGGFLQYARGVIALP